MVRYVDLSSTLRKLGALVCKTDPCFWRVLSADGETLGVLGIHVDDILLAGDEIRLEWVEFVHRLHGMGTLGDGSVQPVLWSWSSTALR